MEAVEDADGISIIVVDDARFTCEIIRRVLQNAGFSDIRVAASARQAHKLMLERPTNILIADWLMPELDGLDLTKAVRELDATRGHYTYIVLLTAKEGTDSICHAFHHGVDDFIGKSHDRKELVARIRAAGRISRLQSALIDTNQRLRKLNRHLEERNSFDPVTGMGNRTFIELQFDNLLRQCEARGGVACGGLIALQTLPELRARHGDRVADSISAMCGARLRQSVRPMDMVGRIKPGLFALLMYHPGWDGCHPNAFRRLHQSLNLRAYRTAAGFLNVEAGIVIGALTAQPGESYNANDILNRLHSEIDAARAQGSVRIVDLSQPKRSVGAE